MSSIFKAVHDGEQLMRYLTEARNELPTVLFIDLNMPRKNGFVCLEEIKNDKNLNQIPVVILSTSYDEHMGDRLYKNGAHYYVCKPPSFSLLKNIIGHVLMLILKVKTKQPPRENFLLSNLNPMLR